jgi:hypothetical protein
MQTTLFWVSLLAVIFVGSASLAGRQATASFDDQTAFIGAWEGSWSGGVSGKFEITIAETAAGKLSGSISPRPDDGGDAYAVRFTTIEVNSGTLTAKFEDPNGDVEVTVTGSVEGKTLKGTYTARQKSDGTQLDTGSWTATRK